MHGILADFLFFFSEHVEEAVEGFADDIFVEIELAGDGTAAWSLFDDAIILLHDSHLFHGSVNDGAEGGGKVGGTGALEVFGGSGVVAGEDVAGVSEGHLFQGSDENLLGFRRGLFGGAIHTDFEGINFISHAEHAQAFADGFKARREDDLDGFVLEKSVGMARGGDGLGGADAESFFEARDDFVVAEAGGVAMLEGGIGFLEDVVELSLGIERAESQTECEAESTHGFLPVDG